MATVQSVYLFLFFTIASLQEVAVGLEEKREVLAHMEADCEALSSCVTPGESGHIWARLSQMRHRWDELKEKVEQLGGHLTQSASYRQRYNDNLEQVFSNMEYANRLEPVRALKKNGLCDYQVKKIMSDLKERLDSSITSCTSSFETYKILQHHMVRKHKGMYTLINILVDTDYQDYQLVSIQQLQHCPWSY